MTLMRSRRRGDAAVIITMAAAAFIAIAGAGFFVEGVRTGQWAVASATLTLSILATLTLVMHYVDGHLSGVFGRPMTKALFAPSHEAARTRSVATIARISDSGVGGDVLHILMDALRKWGVEANKVVETEKVTIHLSRQGDGSFLVRTEATGMSDDELRRVFGEFEAKASEANPPAQQAGRVLSSPVPPQPGTGKRHGSRPSKT